MKVDQRGNLLYVSGPGGAWILSPEGKHLGTITAPELPASFAWGDEDRRTLYMTARTSHYASGSTSPASGRSAGLAGAPARARREREREGPRRARTFPNTAPSTKFRGPPRNSWARHESS
jgi:sugar lactone lactonase YvrE